MKQTLSITALIQGVVMLGVVYAECRKKPFLLNVIMLSVIVLNVIMLTVIMMYVVMLSVIMQNVIMLSVIILNVIMLRVMTPSALLCAYWQTI